MNWHRIHYTFGPEASDTIDVLSEPHSYETLVTIVRANRWLDPKLFAIEVTRLGAGDGSLAVDHDPRDRDLGMPFWIEATKDR